MRLNRKWLVVRPFSAVIWIIHETIPVIVLGSLEAVTAERMTVLIAYADAYYSVATAFHYPIVCTTVAVCYDVVPRAKRAAVFRPDFYEE